jgi:hypothetical protein
MSHPSSQLQVKKQGIVQKKSALPQPFTSSELLALGLASLGDVGKHGGALSSLHVPSARLLEERLGLGPGDSLVDDLATTAACMHSLLHDVLVAEVAELLRRWRHDLI